MSRYYLDIEADSLLMDATRTWIIGVTNLDTKERLSWICEEDGWKNVLSKATLIVGHNVIGYDKWLLKRLYDFDFPKSCNFHDTLIMSQVLDYKRFGMKGHSLEAWGEYLGFPKGKSPDFSRYSQEMFEYWVTDMDLGERVYYELLQELAELAEVAPQIRWYLRAEHAVAEWTTHARVHGWPFDLNAAHKLITSLEAEMNKAYEALSAKLGYKCVPKDKKDGLVLTKRPKWTKAGIYDANTANWFDIDPCSGDEEWGDRPILGEYCRVEVKPLSLDSVQDVKLFLFRNGWEPTEYNYKFDPRTGKKEQTSPKITEDSLEFLGGDGKLYVDFLTARSRYGILKTWIENTDENGLLHGDCMTIGTPSMRTRHSIIVNVPSADSPWGKEMRSLFTCLPGWKLVGCDSAGNQARGLAHYLGDKSFIDTLLNGDIHTDNANKIDRILTELNISWNAHLLSTGVENTPEALAKAKRSVAKRILYAFLFGASGGKLWSYIFGVQDKAVGNKFKNKFIKAVPGFKNLLDKLEKIYGKTSQYGDGYIPSLAGNRIYVDSFHKLLVYLLQSAEKITCSAATMLAMQELEEKKIPYVPLIMMHDEIDFMVIEDRAEEAAEIGKRAFAEGPKLFGVEIMDGDGKVGNNWYEIH